MCLKHLKKIYEMKLKGLKTNGLVEKIQENRTNCVTKLRRKWNNKLKFTVFLLIFFPLSHHNISIEKLNRITLTKIY